MAHNRAVSAWTEWKSAVSQGASQRAIAARLGMPHSKLDRHLNTESPVAETVIAFARAYGVSPTQGLVAAGILTRSEADGNAIRDGLQQASRSELLDELDRRLAGAEAKTRKSDQRYSDREPQRGGPSMAERLLG
ncbi:helix-turn-helix domain-containing protein [Nocardia sp. NPDC051030]|uniref:helix-turn-helix domain-containing protein n=1 Tax=Nocardia sp. NPDC051030 TaxID=3155162 RepID=UPI003434856B